MSLTALLTLAAVLGATVIGALAYVMRIASRLDRMAPPVAASAGAPIAEESTHQDA